jgi:hypothetical protein
MKKSNRLKLSWSIRFVVAFIVGTSYVPLVQASLLILMTCCHCIEFSLLPLPLAKLYTYIQTMDVSEVRVVVHRVRV